MFNKMEEWHWGVDQDSRLHLGLRNEAWGAGVCREARSGGEVPGMAGWEYLTWLLFAPQTTLECTLKPGLVYNKVNPIFHHWSLGDCKFGLTFQSPAEADEFQKSLLAALAALGRGERRTWWALRVGVEGGGSWGPGNSLSAFLPAPGSLTPSSSSSSSSPSQDTAETPCPLTVSLEDQLCWEARGGFYSTNNS